MRIPNVLMISALAGGSLLTAAAAQSQAAQPTAAAVPLPAPAANISAMLGRLEQLSQSMQLDLAKLRVDRWKADSSTKAQADGNVSSLQRNLSDALPNVMAQVRTDPANVATGLKLYRNVNALYEVLSMVTEYAGAFGSKEEYRSLGTDTANLDDARRLLADQLENLALVKEDQINQLKQQVVAAKAAVPPPPPKKIVVDDNPAPKKKTSKKKPAATANSSNPPQ